MVNKKSKKIEYRAEHVDVSDLSGFVQRKYGFKNIAELIALVGKPNNTLRGWAQRQPYFFHLVCLGALAVKNEDMPGNDKLTKEILHDLQEFLHRHKKD